MKMNIKYDKIADAAYVYINSKKAVKTIRMQDNIMADLDVEGKPVGFEILSYSKLGDLSEVKEMIKKSLSAIPSATRA
ncbi:DUF2283 domain-containing protein [bacterium]|nr:DUF2283 domain-containing protein [bacterium]